jgi:hypothetical protein
MNILLKITSDIYHVLLITWYNSNPNHVRKLGRRYDFVNDPMKITSKESLKRFKEFTSNKASLKAAVEGFGKIISIQLARYMTEIGPDITVETGAGGALTGFLDQEVVRAKFAATHPGDVIVPDGRQPRWNPIRNRGTEVEGYGIKPFEYEDNPEYARPAYDPTRRHLPTVLDEVINYDDSADYEAYAKTIKPPRWAKTGEKKSKLIKEPGTGSE